MPKDKSTNHHTETNADLTGCQMMDELWKRSKECNFDQPGLAGTPSRVASYVTCGNVQRFMQTALLKCWQERTANLSTNLPPLPPIFPSKEKQIHFSNKQNKQSSKQPKPGK